MPGLWDLEIKMIVYWGTPLEHLAFRVKQAMVFGDERAAYNYAVKLYHLFVKINPDFWNN
jgi:hypothetical protein